MSTLSTKASEQRHAYGCSGFGIMPPVALSKPLTLLKCPPLGVKHQEPATSVGCSPMITITGHTDI